MSNRHRPSRGAALGHFLLPVWTLLCSQKGKTPLGCSEAFAHTRVPRDGRSCRLWYASWSQVLTGGQLIREDKLQPHIQLTHCDPSPTVNHSKDLICVDLLYIFRANTNFFFYIDIVPINVDIGSWTWTSASPPAWCRSCTALHSHSVSEDCHYCFSPRCPLTHGAYMLLFCFYCLPTQ